MEYLDIKYVAGGMIALGLSFLVASWYVQDQQSAYVAQLKLLTTQQEKTLATLSQLIDKDGADTVVNSLVRDCDADNRTRFDTQLSKLDHLNAAELQEVDSLFDACGHYYTQRRAVMVARLVREYEVYDDYVVLLKIADKRVDLTEYPVAKWTQLVQYEQERSDLSRKLVQIQGEIITALLNGASPSAPEVRDMVSTASDVKDTLSYTGIQIDTLREEVLGL